MNTIRALRQEHGWTQFELALRAGVQPQAVYLWETGRRIPLVPQLRKLGQLFGICTDDILLIEPANAARVEAVQQPHANRHPGEQTPGRDPAGRTVTRSHHAAAVGRDNP